VKKSFSLIEVIIAIALLSVVIVTMFKIKENNLFFLDKFKQTSKYNEFISIATITNKNLNSLRNTHIYLDKVVDFDDDDIRKELKNIKVYIKDKELLSINLNDDDFTLNINIIKSQYKIEDKITKDIYTFRIEK
jgi:K+ transporter